MSFLKLPKIVLASSSPRRAEILTQAGFSFTISAPDIDESVVKYTEPSLLTTELSYLKAAKTAEAFPNNIVIGADTVVVLNGEIIGKPRDDNDACNILTKLSGREHTVYTGVTLLLNAKKTSRVFFDTANVFISHITKNEIQEYIQTKEPADKAGAYAVQGKGCVFVEKITGDFYTVMGLPISKIYKELKEFSI